MTCMRVFSIGKLLSSNGDLKILTNSVRIRSNCGKGMPKKSTKSQKKQDCNVGLPNGAVRMTPNGDIELKIQAKPGAKQNAITGIDEDQVSIQIAAPPTDGAANAELVHYLSKVLGIRKSDLSLDKGSKSRQKTITLTTATTDLTVDAVVAKLQFEESI